jgi:hypothetical protein
MKAKSIVVFAICAIVTLTFTFASVNRTQNKKLKSDKPVTTSIASEEPAGGFVSEDKF